MPWRPMSAPRPREREARQTPHHAWVVIGTHIRTNEWQDTVVITGHHG
jgi:hypothetical protein